MSWGAVIDRSRSCPPLFGPSRAMAGSSGRSSSSSLSLALSEYSTAQMLQICRSKRYRFAGSNAADLQVERRKMRSRSGTSQPGAVKGQDG